MAKTDLEQLVVSLSADIKSYEREMARANKVTVTQLRNIEKQAQSSLGNFEKSFASASKAMAGFGKGLLIGGVTAAVAGIEEIVRTSITSAAAIGDLSDKLGISTDKLQELQYGAVQANMSFDDLQNGLLKFNKTLAQAQNGSGELLKTLEANGYSKAAIKALDYSHALNIVADLIKNAKNEQDAFLITTQAFGKGSDGFAEFLRNGKQGLDDVADAAHRAIAIIQNDLIKNAQVLDDAWAAAMDSMQKQTATFVLNTVKELSKIGGLIDNIIASTTNLKVMPGRFGLAPNPAPPAGIAPTPQSTNIFSEAGSVGGRNYTVPKVSKVDDPELDAERKRLKAEKDAADKKALDTYNRTIKAIKLEGDTIGQSNLQQSIATALSRADVDAKSKQGEAIAKLVTRNELLKGLYDSSIFAVQQATEKQQNYIESLTSLADAGVSSLESWISGTEKLSTVIQDLAKNLLQAAVQASLLGEGPLAGLFGTGKSAGGSGGIFGSLISSLTGGAGSGKNPFYAKGGQIGSGELGIAGEKGPELIKGPANVIPMSAFRGGTGKNSLKLTVINQAGVQVQTSQDSMGNPILTLRKAVADVIGGGHADGALSSRFGALPKKVRR